MSFYRTYSTRSLETKLFIMNIFFTDVRAQLQSNIYGIYTQSSAVSMITRISVIIGDVLVLAATWTKSAQAYREARQLNIRAPLATVLFRDGTTNGPSFPLALNLLMGNFTGTIYFLYAVFLVSRQVSC